MPKKAWLPRCNQPAFDALLGIVEQVFAVDQAIAVRAKDIVLAHHRLSARDAMHVTVMHQHGIEEILSFDSGFDGLSDVRRLS